MTLYETELLARAVLAHVTALKSAPDPEKDHVPSWPHSKICQIGGLDYVVLRAPTNQLLTIYRVTTQGSLKSLRRPPRQLMFPEDAKIKLLKENPHEPGSAAHKRVELFKRGTVGEFRKEAIAKGLAKDGYGHLRHAVKQGLISVEA